MIKIARIQIKNFKSFEDVTFELDPDFKAFTFDVEQDFIDLLKCVDKSTWFKDWDFLTRV